MHHLKVQVMVVLVYLASFANMVLAMLRSAKTMPQPHAPAKGRPLAVASAWAGAFATSYVSGFALLAALGVPAGTAPLVSGAATAIGFHLLARGRKLNRFPGRPHLRALERLTRGLTEVKDTDALAGLVIDQLQKAVGAQRIYLWLPTREGRDFHLAAGNGPDPGEATLLEAWLQAYFLPRERGVDGFELPTPLDGWLAARGLDVCTPIQAHGRTLGLLTYGSKAGKEGFSASDRWFIDQSLRQVALALAYVGLQKMERKRRSKLDNLTHLYKAAQKRAITDGLTGLNTHVFFKEQLSKRFSEGRRHGEPLSVMLVDIDHFKRINDSYGHPMGDEVLRKVSAAIKQISRTDDTVARYGGEELSLVLPLTDIVGAKRLGERIREAIELLDLSDSKGRQLPRITVSVGVSALEAADTEAAVLIERADQALYAAKRSGRNQVCMAS
jgi:diguanylate cyclase (GGDEF)-like protein